MTKERITKLEVVSAVEETKGLSPAEALALAEECPPPESTRVFARDYMPAMAALVGKGFTVKGAAERLVELGCPFSCGTLDITYRRMREQA